MRELPEKKLVGKKMRMSLANNTTGDLWRDFMPLRSAVRHKAGTDLFSMQVYDDTSCFSRFDPRNEFYKWAAVEVTMFEEIPDGMETFVLKGGHYAVFIHHGLPSEGDRTFGYIFGTWFPASAYDLDDRPHFEILGSKYRNGSPDSEEEVWIPVRPRQTDSAK